MEQQHTTQSLKETPNLKRMRKEEESLLLLALVNGQEGKQILRLQGTWAGLKINRPSPAPRNNIQAQIHFVGLGQALGSVW